MKYTTVYVRKLDRKNNPWQARAKYKDVDGKWKEVSKMMKGANGIRAAERMAKEWLDALNAEADLMPQAGQSDTVDKTYTEYTNHQLQTGEIEESTYSNIMQYYARYIKPYLGDYMFSTVDNVVINWWLTQLYHKGLSQNTIHTAYMRLKKVYRYFYNNGELLNNPFKGVKEPKRGETKVTHLTDEQMKDVLDAVNRLKPQDPMRVGILLAFYAGLRRGEICGLRWNDIDFNMHTITVRSAVGVCGIKGRKDYTKNPKTKCSNRTFPMLPQLEQALKERKEAIQPKGSWFIVGEGEQFLHPPQYSRLFRKFVEHNNLVDAYGKMIEPHGLRHNFATVGIRSGMDIASLALMMGHASRAMTLDIYGDANADALSVASVKLADTFTKTTSHQKEEEEQ